MLTSHWQPDVAPDWVTSVPSLRAPKLVRGLASRLADRLGLEYRQALEKLPGIPPQKTMENLAHQAGNALTGFRAVHDAVRPGVVLLIDDVVDSRWTLTACGALLVEAGSGPVVPIALAQATTHSATS